MVFTREHLSTNHWNEPKSFGSGKYHRSTVQAKKNFLWHFITTCEMKYDFLLVLAGERPIGRMAFYNIIKMQEAKFLWFFLQNFAGILDVWCVCMNHRAISFNLICHMQFSDVSVLGTVGILRSSPICRYPADVCRCPGWATTGQNGKTDFRL